MRTQPFVSVLGLLALSSVVCLAAAGCSSSDNPSQVAGNNGQGGAQIIGGGQAGGLAVGATGSGASSGIPTDGGVVNPDAACAQSSSTASLGQLTMLVMMDDSGSMNDNNKWNQAAGAMKAFFADPAAAGVRVGLRLFPSDTPTAGCTKTVCNARTNGQMGMTGQDKAITACSTPLVDIAELTAAAAPADVQEGKLIAAVPANPQGKGGQDSGGTPTYAALQGAENIAIGYAAAHPAEKVVVVFVTDGEPNGCDERIPDIAKIAADTLATKKISTYAIGILGSTVSTIDAIAVAGGTKGIIIGGSDGATTEKDLLAAFGNIKSANVSCDFAVPAAPANLMLSINNVNVNYTPGKGAAATLLRVKDAASCGATGGWYYDDNTTPTQIHLCANTCMTVQADAGAALQVLYSCVDSQGYNPPK